MRADEETSQCEHLLKKTSTEGQDIKKVVGGRDIQQLCAEMDLSMCPPW